jgi:15-cis-phytoene synthase
LLRTKDIAVCNQILRQGSKSFALASLMLPGRVRGSVAAVYAFCRVADDLIDHARAAESALETLQQRLALIYAGTPQDTPVDRAFGEVVFQYGIPHTVPEALFEGFLWDLQRRSYETLADLRAYAVRVASTVGVMMAQLMGVREPETLARACELGAAMQLTNIARDVGEDARAGRLYLPRQWLQEAGLDPALLMAKPTFSPSLAQVIKRLLDEADRLYDAADEGIFLLPRDCQTAIRTARLVYAEIGAALRQRGFDSINGRVFTSRWRKIQLLGRAWFSKPPGAKKVLQEVLLPEACFLIQSDKSVTYRAAGLSLND